MPGKLILFPVPIGSDSPHYSLPPYNSEMLNTCHTFIVEDIRTARRNLKHMGYEYPIDDTKFFELRQECGTDERSGIALCGRPRKHYSDDGPPQEYRDNALDRSQQHHAGTHVLRVQRTEFRLSGLSTHKQQPTISPLQKDRATDIPRRPNSNTYRSPLSQR